MTVRAMIIDLMYRWMGLIWLKMLIVSMRTRVVIMCRPEIHLLYVIVMSSSPLKIFLHLILLKVFAFVVLLLQAFIQLHDGYVRSHFCNLNFFLITSTTSYIVD